MPRFYDVPLDQGEAEEIRLALETALHGGANVFLKGERDFIPKPSKDNPFSALSVKDGRVVHLAS